MSSILTMQRYGFFYRQTNEHIYITIDYDYHKLKSV